MKSSSNHWNAFLSYAILLSLGVFLASSTGLLRAQDEVPFEEESAAEAAKPKPKAENKAAAKPSDESFGKEELPDDPAVAALLATNPTTPVECAKTANILLKLRQPSLAKDQIRKVLDANLDKTQLAALGRQLGPSMFLAMSQAAELQPVGKQLGDAVLEAMRGELQDPQKIATAIEQLQDPSVEKRTQALQELQDGGSPAIEALIAVLADPKRESEFKNVRAALARMGRRASNALIGISEGADSGLKAQAFLALGDAVAIEAKYFLLGPASRPADDEKETAVAKAAQYALKRIAGKLPSKPEAEKLLVTIADAYLNRQPPFPDAVDRKVDIWRWDAKERKCAISTLPVEDARLATAARFARDAMALAPNDAQARYLYWTAKLDAAAYLAGLDKPIGEESTAGLAELGVKKLEEILDYAVATKHYPAATAATVGLAKIGKADELLYPTVGESILAKAIEQSDRRLRLEALKAIVGLKPEKLYPGSSKVIDALAFFAAGTGTRRALVAGPNLNKIPKLVSGLSAAGYTVETVNSGKEVLEKLLASPDYEITMIDAGVSRPSIDMLVQQIRRDVRSADVRVGIIARAGDFEKAEHVADADPLTKDFPRPNDDEAVRWEAERLGAIAPRDLVSPEERLRQAERSLEILTELARTSPKLYDIRRVQDIVISALKTPSLAEKAITVLAKINSPDAQRALAATVGRDALPIEPRRAAVEAFRENVQAHGILLTTEEIRRQYDAYNQSEHSDESTQKVLGLLLDCLEAPKK